MPDLSENASIALTAIVSAFNAGGTLTPESREETLVRQAVLRLYAVLGRAPDLLQLIARTRIDKTLLRATLNQLNRRDLIVLNDGGEITGAYPITSNPTEHHVRVGSQTINAMCAIDALGVGAMYNQDVHIRSSCRNCGAEVQIHTADKGRALAAVTPLDICVWSGIRPSVGRAETTLCMVLAFFCSDRCLETWRKENPADADGYQLSPNQGLEVGRALFEDALRPSA